MSARTFAAVVLASSLSLLFPWSASALGRFDVKPISITFAHGETAASVEITNDGVVPQELEIALTSWTQSDGSDDGESTDDIIVSPSIFIIPPGKTQLVRLGPARPLGGDVERSYRLVATEVPGAGSSGSVQAVLRMRLPIFVSPQTIVATPLVWNVTRDDAAHVTVSARNAGNVHRRIRSIRIEAGGRIVFDNVVAAYVLAHQSRQWLVPLAADTRTQAVRVVSTEMDGSTREAALRVR